MPFASSYRLTNFRDSFRRFSTSSILERNLYVIICTNSPVVPSWSEVPYIKHNCLKASKTLCAAFLTIFRAPFCVSIVRKYSASQTVVRAVLSLTVSLLSAGFSVPVEGKLQVIKVLAKNVRLLLPDSHVLTWFRYRLSPCSHSFCDSRHCRVHHVR